MYKRMGKVVIKILQGSAVIQTVLGGLTGCKFPIVYMCQKLWKLASSRQSYCKNCQAYFFGPPCSYSKFLSTQIHRDSTHPHRADSSHCGRPRIFSSEMQSSSVAVHCA